VQSTRRAALTSTFAAGVVTVAGCDKPAGRTAPTAAPTAAPSGAIRTADIPVGGGKIFPDLDPDGTVVTQPEAGIFLAFSGTCTHRGCFLASVGGGTINCPCHGGRFSIADGSVVRPGDGIPAETTPLPRKQVTVSGDTLKVG
jgi:Rieske Fe-S protein